MSLVIERCFASLGPIFAVFAVFAAFGSCMTSSLVVDWYVVHSGTRPYARYCDFKIQERPNAQGRPKTIGYVGPV